jgi:putative glutamine amidotransferase
MRPLIGIGSWLGDDPDVGPTISVSTRYADAVAAAGGLPVILPQLPSLAEEMLKRLDGLVLPGGADVGPACYGAAVDGARKTQPRRDEQELLLVRAARRIGLPVLGICRGSQVLNVALGGTLKQHVDGHEPGSVEPSAVAGRLHHEVVLRGFLRELFGAERIRVNSYHHQVCDRLAQGLLEGARSEDGLIEGFASDDGFLLGVQWHPEFLVPELPEHTAVFRWIVDKATERKGRAS